MSENYFDMLSTKLMTVSKSRYIHFYDCTDGLTVYIILRKDGVTSLSTFNYTMYNNYNKESCFLIIPYIPPISCTSGNSSMPKCHNY